MTFMFVWADLNSEYQQISVGKVRVYWNLHDTAIGKLWNTEYQGSNS